MRGMVRNMEHWWHPKNEKNWPMARHMENYGSTRETEAKASTISGPSLHHIKDTHFLAVPLTCLAHVEERFNDMLTIDAESESLHIFSSQTFPVFALGGEILEVSLLVCENCSSANGDIEAA